MTELNQICPSAAILEQLLAGDLSEGMASPIREHLAECSDCVAAMDRLSEDSVLRQLQRDGRRARRADATPIGPGLASILQQLGDSTDACQAADTVGSSQASPPRLESSPLAGDLSRLGPYAIEAELGRGGMGVVYRAHDRELNRTVALKVLHTDPLDETSRARFLREAQAAARVQHPNLVTLYAAVTPPDGPPVLAMELIDGLTLRERIQRDGQLAPRTAATIVAQVAEGLAAAHATGLVHRDVKPSNVLLDSRSSSPTPHTPRAKLADFGLARMADGASRLTQLGTLAGTPSYMSPEQIRDPDRTDLRSDVYGLGMTLYEALTGELPFRGLPHLVLAQIERDEPRPPRQLNDAVPRDLETICLKAISKEPARRYGNAGEFADDLNRWLRGEPIQARPIGPLGRLTRWCLRKPLVASLAATLLLVVAVAFSTVTWLWRSADAHAERATANAERAALAERAANEHARHSEINARQAEENFRESLQAVSGFQELVKQGLLSNKPMDEKVRAKTIQDLLAFYQNMLERHRHDPALRAELADASLKLAQVVVEYTGGVDIPPVIELAIETYESLLVEQPGDAHLWENLGWCHFLLGDWLNRTGQSAAALKAMSRSRDAFTRLLELKPGLPLARRQLAASYGNMAMVHWHLGQMDDARRLWLEQAPIQERLCQEFPEVNAYQVDLGKTFFNIALTCKGAEQLPFLERSRSIRERLVAAKPDSPLNMRLLGRTYSILAGTHATLGNEAEARSMFQLALSLADRARQITPLMPRIRLDRGQCYLNAGGFELKSNQVDEAARFLEIAQSEYRGVLESNPAEIEASEGLAKSLLQLGRARVAAGDSDQAAADFQESIALDVKILAALPNQVTTLQRVADSYQYLAELHHARGDSEQASDSLQQAIRYLERWAALDPNDSSSQEKLQAAQRLLESWP